MVKSHITFRSYQPKDQAATVALTLLLYDDEPGVMSKAKVTKTIQRLLRHPDQGSVIVFEQNCQVVGSAMLIYFWSNEYGGHVVVIDELCVFPQYRSQGVATQFFRWLIRRRPKQCKLLQLEVVHSNVRAYKLYRRFGFKSHKNNVMTLELRNNQGTLASVEQLDKHLMIK